MPRVQTEAEERAALLDEAAWLASRSYRLTGKLPRIIIEALEEGAINLRTKSSEEIAALCVAIRAECPALEGETPWQNG
jgi:hypothetical protein